MPRYVFEIQGKRHVFEGPDAQTATRFAERWAAENAGSGYARGRGQGPASGFVDTLNRSIPGLSELGAGLEAGAGTLDDALAGRPADFGVRWGQARARQQGSVDQFQASHPAGASLTRGLGLAGPAAAAMLTGGAAGLPDLARLGDGGLQAAARRVGVGVARNAMTGAAMGGLYGAAQPGTLGQRIANADRGLAPGAAWGAALPLALAGAGRLARAAVRGPWPAASTEVAPAAAAADAPAAVRMVEPSPRVGDGLAFSPDAEIATPDEAFIAQRNLQDERLATYPGRINKYFQNRAAPMLAEPFLEDPDVTGYSRQQLSEMMDTLSRYADRYRPRGPSGQLMAQEMDNLRHNLAAMASRSQPRFADAFGDSVGPAGPAIPPQPPSTDIPASASGRPTGSVSDLRALAEIPDDVVAAPDEQFTRVRDIQDRRLASYPGRINKYFQQRAAPMLAEPFLDDPDVTGYSGAQLADMAGALTRYADRYRPYGQNGQLMAQELETLRDHLASLASRTQPRFADVLGGPPHASGASASRNPMSWPPGVRTAPASSGPGAWPVSAVGDLAGFPDTVVAAPDNTFTALRHIQDDRLGAYPGRINKYFQRRAGGMLAEPFLDDPDVTGYSGQQLVDMMGTLAKYADRYRLHGEAGQTMADEMDTLRNNLAAMAYRTQPRFGDILKDSGAPVNEAEMFKFRLKHQDRPGPVMDYTEFDEPPPERKRVGERFTRRGYDPARVVRVPANDNDPWSEQAIARRNVTPFGRFPRATVKGPPQTFGLQWDGKQWQGDPLPEPVNDRPTKSAEEAMWDELGEDARKQYYSYTPEQREYLNQMIAFGVNSAPDQKMAMFRELPNGVVNFNLYRSQTIGRPVANPAYAGFTLPADPSRQLPDGVASLDAWRAGRRGSPDVVAPAAPQTLVPQTAAPGQIPAATPNAMDYGAPVPWAATARGAPARRVAPLLGVPTWPSLLPPLVASPARGRDGPG